MILDARTDAVGEKLTAKVVVLGAGASGLTVARKLGAHTDGVLLIDSGARTLEGQTQALAAGRSLAIRYWDLLATRLRYYGGTTNHWTGYCRPHVALDYEARPELGILPWPVDQAEMTRWIDEAARVLRIEAPFGDQPAALKSRNLDPRGMIENRPGFSGEIETRSFQITEILKLAGHHEAEIAALAGLRRVFNLNAVDIVPNGRRIDHVTARTTTGKQVEIRGDVYVLCCHGIENARILLSSNSASAAGVGNAHGNVGRHFSEHGAIRHSFFLPSNDFPEIYNFGVVRRRRLDVHLALSEAKMRAENVLHSYVRFVPTTSFPRTRDALLRLRQSFLKPFDAQVGSDLQTLLGNLDEVAAGAIASVRPASRADDRFALIQRFEQAPNPLSRVVLSNRRNAIGQPQADIQWQLNDLDMRTIRVGYEAVAREVSALGLGRFQLEPLDRRTIESRIEGTHHQMGTTRMSARPEDGVVDFDGRVHDLDNLYIGGSSVFPHPGDGSPTINIIALALRLAEHLGGRFG